MSRKSRRRTKSPIVDLEAQPEHKEVRQSGTYEMNTQTSGRDGGASGAAGSNAAVEQADREDPAGPSTESLAPAQEGAPSNSGGNDQLDHSGISTNTTRSRSMSPETPRMIGDFDDSANALWSLHMKEAKGHDEIRIQSLKNDMDSNFVFAGLFSAAITSFLVDKLNDLQVDPAKQMVYYQQQNVVLLAQISNQVSSIAPQVSIPSTPPPPYPDFTPNSSDVRVSAFWIMSLISSLSAALLATLVQQWVRDYMNVFRRYDNPLMSARLRQYLYEGAERWHMPVVAESVLGLVHVSVFLFFLGLCDSFLGLNTAVGITGVFPVAACCLFYVLSMFAPTIDPQSPFRNPFSGLFWFLTQKVHLRRYLDQASGGALRSVSADMTEGREQLAMEENGERKDRDARAIQWLIQNKTEDDEMESFVAAIPGTFTSQWGIEVWRKVSEVMGDEDAISKPNDPVARPQTDGDHRVSVLPHHGSSSPQRTSHPRSLLRPFGRIVRMCIANGTPHDVTVTQSIPHLTYSGQALDYPQVTNGPAIHNLYRRVRHLLDTCNNRSLFANEELRHKRARGCVEAVASLVFCADVQPELFGDPEGLLRELCETEKIRQLLAAGSDGSFITHWTCLSLTVVARGFSRHDIMECAATAINDLSRYQKRKRANDSDIDEEALQNARNIDNDFEIARQFCVNGLREAFRPGEVGWEEGQVRGVLARNYEADISTLERIAPATGRMGRIDLSISTVNHIIRSINGGLNVHLPGVSFDEFSKLELNDPIQFFNHSVAEGKVFTPQLIFLRQRLQFLCSYSPKLRDIICGRSHGIYQKTLNSLRTLWDDADHEELSIVGQRHLMERQLWRLLDLRDGGGFGFSVELFFLVLARLLSMTSSWDTHSALYIGTFRAITSDWRRYKHSIGTQRVILNLACDMAITGRGICSDRSYPRGITNELLVLLRDMVEGQSGSHIDDAKMELDQKLEALPPESKGGYLFVKEAIKVISESRASVLP